MANDGPKKDPFSKGIKEVVGLANRGLSKLERVAKDVQEPIIHSIGTIGAESSKAVEFASNFYERRKEFAPQIVASSALFTGAVFTLRRGRFAGMIGASVAGTAAYGIVYDKLSAKEILESVFPKKD